MKKTIYAVILILSTTHQLHAQGFLDKVKSKVNKAIEAKDPVKNNTSASSPDLKYTDPAKFGTLLMTYAPKEVESHMGGSEGGFDLWFALVKVVNNQLEFKVADYDHIIGSYSNGTFQRSAEAIDLNLQNKIPNGSERELQSKDFSSIDNYNALLKKGGHVASGTIPGKIGQTYTFNGKVIGTFFQAFIAHNADSTTVAVVGSSFDKGLSYSLASSNGQKTPLDIKIMGFPLISADGKTSAAVVQSLSGGGADVYLINGNKIHIGNYNNNDDAGLWLRNSGSIFYVEGNKSNVLVKNGEPYYTFEFPVNNRTLFISADDKSMCWPGRNTLYFSDGTVFENGECPHKVMINNKEVIVFLTVNVHSGQVYLCQHDL